jgi:hypothetical protein
MVGIILFYSELISDLIFYTEECIITMRTVAA